MKKLAEDMFPKKTSRWLTDTWKDAQHHLSSEKYTSETQLDTTLHLSEWLTLTTQETTDVGEDAEKEEHFCTTGGNAHWVQPLWKTVWSFLKKLKTELLYDPAIVLLGYLSKWCKIADLKGHMHPNGYSSTINNSQIMEWAQMSIDWRMVKEDVIYIHNGILLGDQKEWKLIIYNSVDGTRVYYATRNKSEKDRYHMISLLCGIWETQQMNIQCCMSLHLNQNKNN